MFKRIKFPTTQTKYFKRIEGQSFDFTSKNQEAANFVILIGKNGSGKTTLLDWIERLYTWWNEKFCIEGLPEIKLTNDLDNSCDDNCLLVNCHKNNINYCLQLLPLDTLGIFHNEYNEETFYKKCHLQTIFVSDEKMKNISHEKFFKKINEWDTYIEPKEKEYTFSFKETISKDFKKLGELKSKIVKKYVEKEIEMYKDIENCNKWLPETKKIDPQYLQTNFQKITHEFSKITNLYLSIIKDSKNIDILITKKDEKQPITFENLSSGQRKLLIIIFQILEVRLFDDDKRLFLFIDELENSFYPKTQEKIVKYLIELSRDFKKENIEHQFFISTHSPFILKNFLKNSDDTAIINVENNENIEKSKDKKLLLNRDNISSYDEISYLYYDIATTSYYISLYETIDWKIKNECLLKLNLDRRKTEEFYFSFLSHIGNFKLLKNKIYKVACIKSSDKLNKMRNSKQRKIKHEDLSQVYNITLLRNMLAHNDNSLNWNIEIFKDKENSQIFEKFKESKPFYDSFNKRSDFEQFLKNNIEILRTILINWNEITNNFKIPNFK